VKIQFDAKQQYQLDAVSAVVDIFDGQPLAALDFTNFLIVDSLPLFHGQTRTELGMGNQILIPLDKLHKNVRAVQEKNGIEISNPDAELEHWPLNGSDKEKIRTCYHFSVEMETGTGKTYVYLRTIFELSKRYGFKKFIIVVPSVAIREGVLKNIEITADHFKAIYNNVEFESFVYEAKKINKLRQFAVSNTIQLMIINIDAFRKNFTGTDAENKSNVIYKESDKLSGRQPIEYVQAANPIVIIDEPQSVDNTDKAQEAIKALNPLCTLRYSATHRNPYNLVYRLDPIRAFELRLVKQIVVGSSVASGHMNDAYIRVDKIETQNGIKAKLGIHAQTNEGPKEKQVIIKKNGADLYELSNNRACYQDGFVVTEISAEPGNEFIRFNNGTTLKLGQEISGMQADIWRVQIVNTVKKHLDKELEVMGKGLKVISLFFIDRVANYRSYDETGRPQQGKFAQELEKAISTLSKEKKYESIGWLNDPNIPIEKIHNGYFAQDKKGILKDTRGDTQADDDVYNLIMKDKEKLLTLDVPLRFIFSHSALREGWDNPNVFQICTLNETRSVMKKRQEIGRGLRLPVNQNGERIFDDSINKLFVVANESYEDFARALQTEYEEECGITFGKVPISAFAKLELFVDEQTKLLGKEASAEIWKSLIAGGILDADGKIQDAFDPKKEGFSLPLAEEHRELEKSISEILSSYQIERHIRRERDEGRNLLKKSIQLSAEFSALWEKIKPKTTYRVEFSTEELVTKAVSAIRRMERIEPAIVNFDIASLDLTKGGVTTKTLRTSQETIRYMGGLPDLIAYLQNETELTRSTLVRILKESGRLSDFFVNPQRFMDGVAAALKYELHRLLVDGIKYERIPAADQDATWEMMLFKNEEIINYLTALQVNKSVYEYVVYDSDIEREFAKKLDEREDIKLFVKLPGWFEIETPVGKYNPDWAILKHNDQTLYLVRETKSTHNFLKLRTTEADKVRCGQKHFEALGVPFAVAVSADEV